MVYILEDQFPAGTKVMIDLRDKYSLSRPGQYSFDYRVGPGVDDVVGTVVRAYDRTITVTVDIGEVTGETARMGMLGQVKATPNMVTIVDDDYKPKRPYEVPEGMIDPNDPRLEWFWDYISGLAPVRTFCSEYDRILKIAGLPPRKQKYDITVPYGGLTIKVEVMARSLPDANNIAKERVEKMIADEVAKRTEVES